MARLKKVGTMLAATAQPAGTPVAVQVLGATPDPVPVIGTLALFVPETFAEAACGVTLIVRMALAPPGIPAALVIVHVNNCPVATVPEATQDAPVSPAPGAELLKLIFGGN